ncbi:hypothetical protein EcSzw1_121 [Escherichia phage EcSzw_1]|nr:hypothetical protein EcSzw2_121 [Escherichia phage EcSzw-2]QAY01057.1 hypothetical protein EcSzw1_121 [Escherichia phage EcSzw_1]
MSKKIPVIVDVSAHGSMGERDAEGTIFQHEGQLRLLFNKSGSILKHVYDDADGCPVFGWCGIDFPLYAIHYPDGQEDWTTQSIFDELNGIPLETKVESKPTELTFTFITEEKVGDISVTEAIQVTQVIC